MIRLLLPIILLSGCADRVNNPVETAQPSPVPGVECNANGVSTLFGQQRSDAVEAEAKKITSAKAVRWISPGMGVTMDYRVDRLNLNLNDAGIIISAHCG